MQHLSDSTISLSLNTLLEVQRVYEQRELYIGHTFALNLACSSWHSLKKAEIIPEVLDDFSPAFALSLSYPAAHQTVSLGNTIPPSDASSAPVFEIHTTSLPLSLSPTRTLAHNKTYTLVLTDPDATSRAKPTKGQMCHWIVTGIPLTASNSSEGIDEASAYTLELSPHVHDNLVPKLKHLVEYLPPSPPPGTGKHRYIFVLLASEGDDDRTSEPEKPTDRPHWGYGKVGAGVREFCKDNNLVPVGMPIPYSYSIESLRPTR